MWLMSSHSHYPEAKHLCTYQVLWKAEESLVVEEQITCEKLYCQTSILHNSYMNYLDFYLWKNEDNTTFHVKV